MVNNDSVQLQNGERFTPFCDIIGLDIVKDSVIGITSGFDKFHPVGDELSKKEAIDIANFMIKKWQDFKEKLDDLV